MRQTKAVLQAARKSVEKTLYFKGLPKGSFPGLKTPASLKRGLTPTQTIAALRFPGLKTPASLKRYCGAKRPPKSNGFPGLKTPASLKPPMLSASDVSVLAFSGPKNPGLVEALQRAKMARRARRVFRA